MPAIESQGWHPAKGRGCVYVDESKHNLFFPKALIRGNGKVLVNSAALTSGLEANRQVGKGSFPAGENHIKGLVEFRRCGHKQTAIVILQGGRKCVSASKCRQYLEAI